MGQLDKFAASARDGRTIVEKCSSDWHADNVLPPPTTSCLVWCGSDYRLAFWEDGPDNAITWCDHHTGRALREDLHVYMWMRLPDIPHGRSDARAEAASWSRFR